MFCCLLEQFYFWIAAYDIEIENTWVLSESHQPIVYTNWSPGEPNNGAHDENCIALASTGLWTDLSCHDYMHFICEKPEE